MKSCKFGKGVLICMKKAIAFLVGSLLFLAVLSASAFADQMGLYEDEFMRTSTDQGVVTYDEGVFAHTGNSTVQMSSDKSSAMGFTSSVDSLPAPSNLLLSDDLVLQWDNIPNVEYYWYSISFSGGGTDLYDGSLFYDWSVNDSIASYDFSERIEYFLLSNNLVNQVITIKIDLTATGTVIYDSKEYAVNSPYSVSNEIQYRLNATIDSLPAPSNLLLSDDLVLQWVNIPNVNRYWYYISFSGEEDLYDSFYISNWSVNSSIASYDFSEMIEEFLISHNIANEEIAIKISLSAEGTTIYNSKEITIKSPSSDYSKATPRNSQSKN